MYAIEIKNLSKNYKGVKAVKNLSFNIKKGDFFGFIGPNGAGKTTTINSIVGLVNFEGSIKVSGYDVIKDYRQARNLIGLSPQEYNFDRFLTVEECLLYTAGYYGLKKLEAKKRTNQLLKRFRLYDHRKKRSEMLSGGMKRRLIIARALIHKPEILILDEPTAGVDVKLRKELWDDLRKVNKEGTTIILTSHYIEEIEELCNTVCIINKGKIVALDEKKKIMENLSDQTLKITTDKKVPEKFLPKKHFKISQEDTILKITGKGVRKNANKIIKSIEKANIKVKEIDITHESLEKVFLRITGDDK